MSSEDLLSSLVSSYVKQFDKLVMGLYAVQLQEGRPHTLLILELGIKYRGHIF